MFRKSLAAVLATLAAIAIVPAAQAAVAPACGGLLMPAAALKQFSRGFSAWHSGVDLTAPYGSPVRAAEGGTVVFAGRYYGYGNMIDLRDPAGIVTRYAHLSAYARGLHVGTTVAGGEEIGRIGTSGRAHGAHLHFEVRIDGRAVDPAPYLALASCPTGPGRMPIEEARAPESARPLPPVAVPAAAGVPTEVRPGGQ